MQVASIMAGQGHHVEVFLIDDSIHWAQIGMAEGIRAATAGLLEVREFRPSSMRIAACTACGECDRTGQCVIGDDMMEIYESVRWARGVVFACPVFFASMPAAAKAMVDRFQCAWVAKYRLGSPWVDAAERLLSGGPPAATVTALCR